MDLKVTLKEYFLEFKVPFSIAHGVRKGTGVVYIKLQIDNYEGWGEAVLPPYLPETKQSVTEFIKQLDFCNYSQDFDLNEVLDYVIQSQPNNYSAKAAVDIALHNLFANIHKTTIHGIYKLGFPEDAFTTYTIGMGTITDMQAKVKAASNFRLLKVKLGGQDDKATIKAIREFTDKQVCIDVNQGWKTKEEALKMINWLTTQNVLFVEQPLHKNDLAGHKWLTENSPLPIIADESVQTIEDVEKVKDCFNGINVKLMKCGGVREGYRMLKKAEQLNLTTLVGCMSGSSCAVAAAANLASLTNYLDLDGPLLIKNDLFSGIEYGNEGKIKLTTQ
jgi:L-alanine-DL-glutamate epimerase-like enolase superfamily enzyme